MSNVIKTTNEDSRAWVAQISLIHNKGTHRYEREDKDATN